jgi:hypothetical protein
MCATILDANRNFYGETGSGKARDFEKRGRELKAIGCFQEEARAEIQETHGWNNGSGW